MRAISARHAWGRKHAWGSAACTAAALLAAPAVAFADTGDLSAREITDKAQQELLDAKSVRLDLEQKGKDVAKGDPVAMNLALDQDGNCAGTLRMAEGGGSLKLIKQGEKVWMKPDLAFWKAQLPGGQGEAAADIIGDRYLYGTTDDPMLRSIAETCDLNTIQKQVKGESGGATDLKKGKPTKVDGTRVIPVTGRDDGKKTTLYVAAKGTPYLVEATSVGAGTNSTLKLSDYDKPVPSKTPSKEDSVDVSQLQGGGGQDEGGQDGYRV
ncbi:hypothetical protein ACGFSB_16750 [Streptomyces sp. NPDC048441]|uniref:hypothetical protein n=1 Tax=Streptomyces sp. NPDC048441 TaxID=3365552 RepID=UPI00371752A1